MATGRIEPKVLSPKLTHSITLCLDLERRESEAKIPALGGHPKNIIMLSPDLSRAWVVDTGSVSILLQGFSSIRVSSSSFGTSLTVYVFS